MIRRVDINSQCGGNLRKRLHKTELFTYHIISKLGSENIVRVRDDQKLLLDWILRFITLRLIVRDQTLLYAFYKHLLVQKLMEDSLFHNGDERFDDK